VSDWFKTLLDSAPEVYFRYTLAPSRAFAYVSPSIETLTGHAPDAFLAEPAFCLTLAPREDRRVLRQIARARRPLTTTLHLRHRDGTLVALDLRTVPVTAAGRGGKVVAVEGVATPVRVQPALDFAVGELSPPVQQRLAALLCEVHSLLHGNPERHRSASLQASEPSNAPLQVGDIVIDVDRMIVSLAGEPVALTTRELLVLRYLLQHQGRLVSRAQLLEHVWGYRYTGDHRTVDVHVSRLRKKLPPLRAMLHAVKHLGYRLDPPERRHSTRLA